MHERSLHATREKIPACQILVTYSSQQLATMSAELRTLTSYFAAFDGKKSWDEVKPLALNLAHPNITIHHGDKLLNYAEWLATVENFTNSGGSVDMIKFEAIEGGSHPLVRYTVRLNFADGTSSKASSTGTFQDGKLIRVEPDEGAQGTYDKLFGTAAGPAQVATEQ